MSSNQYPPGWDEKRVKRVIDHYEAQTDEEAAEEDERAYLDAKVTLMEVPIDLVPAVRELIAKRGKAA